jgi:hypothetical protein
MDKEEVLDRWDVYAGLETGHRSARKGPQNVFPAEGRRKWEGIKVDMLGGQV